MKAFLQLKPKLAVTLNGIAQPPFMLEKAKTNAFQMKMTVKGDELTYREVTSLHIYGKDFEHVDSSTLQRVTYEQG